MAYPTDKETFRRVVNQDLPAVEGDILDEDDQNLPADFLERLQDTLGYGIKMGYATVKAFFDWIVSKFSTNDTNITNLQGAVTGKVDKTGDTMSGHLLMNDVSSTSPRIKFITTATSDCYIEADSQNIDIKAKNAVEINTTSYGAIAEFGGGHIIKFYKELKMNNEPIYDVGNITLDAYGYDFINPGLGKGIIVKTPDGTKSYRISVDNAGNIISTLI